MPRTRTIALAAAAALGLAPLLAPSGATAASVHYMSYLRFPDSAPGDALYGPDAVLKGAVRPESPDLVDFSGRSVVDVGSSSSLDPGTYDFTFGAVLRLTRGS